MLLSCQCIVHLASSATSTSASAGGGLTWLRRPGRNDLKRGELTGTDEPVVLKDTGAVVCWDGGAGWPDRPPLNGLYTTAEAVKTALDRSDEHGVATVIVRRSSHTGCLQAFLEAATSRQCMVIIASCGPGVRSVAPHGGTTGTLHPNPYAVGIPSSPVPILVDMSVRFILIAHDKLLGHNKLKPYPTCAMQMGITANSNYRRAFDEGKQMPGKWVLTPNGTPTRDPAVLFDEDRPGVAMGIGGQDHGHKGFGLGLMVEALTIG
jgi:LDH2 family malate/lactate/ureidoglycolate dehydrogenase